MTIYKKLEEAIRRAPANRTMLVSISPTHPLMPVVRVVEKILGRVPSLDEVLAAAQFFENEVLTQSQTADTRGSTSSDLPGGTTTQETQDDDCD
jgi:hypothetical protein